MRSGRIVIVNLEQNATCLRFERTVPRARRPASVGVRRKAFAVAPVLVVPYDQVAREHVDLFPVFVDEGLSGEGTRGNAHEPRARASLVGFVEMARQDLVLHPRRISGNRLPAFTEIQSI